MSDGLPISVCATCGHSVFPARLLCPACGASEWERRDVGEGVVEETTVLRRAPGTAALDPVHLGGVRVEPGLVVVARLDPGLGPDDRVELEYRDGIPIARRREAR